MAGFVLTKAHVLKAFSHLSETKDAEHRKKFLTEYVDPNVIWTCTGSAHSLAGTRYSVKEHDEATFKRLGKKLQGPIKFIPTRVVVDAEAEDDGWWCVVETTGEATRITGEPYDNEYAWLMRWNGDGKIVEIRSYFDTLLSEKVLLGLE
jgi:ketosteroid isomerase-like protein